MFTDENVNKPQYGTFTTIDGDALAVVALKCQERTIHQRALAVDLSGYPDGEKLRNQVKKGLPTFLGDHGDVVLYTWMNICNVEVHLSIIVRFI